MIPREDEAAASERHTIDCITGPESRASPVSPARERGVVLSLTRPSG